MAGYGLATFCLAYGIAVATPGPGVAAVLAQGLGRGSAGAAPFIAGFVIGDLIWFAAAALGLGALAQSAHGLFVAVKYAGAAYLLFLAYRLWTARALPVREADPASGADSALDLLLGSLTLTLGNPKPMIFFVALLPTVVPLESLTLAGGLEVAAAIAVILPAILGGYVVLAARARRWLRDARSMRLVNRGSGTLMAAAAVTVAVR